MAKQQTRIITDNADYERYKKNQSSDGHIEYAADARNHKVTMLIPFLGCFNCYSDGSAANYIVSEFCRFFS